MRVLLVGGGGREHALAWKLSQSPRLAKLYAAPGNPGIAAHAELVELDVADHVAVIAFCNEQAVNLVIMGPEAPLVAGLADDLRWAGIKAFGPSAAAAQLEGSKGFTKALCDAESVPTARFRQARDMDELPEALKAFGFPIVIKADGLAAGKGVVIAGEEDEARAAGAAMLETGAVVVEEFLTGEEVSLFVLCDGTAALPLGSVQDHKRVGDGDTGPNTGGMGAYSPAPILTAELETRAMNEIVRPTLAAMARGGAPFSGVLYAGLMLTAEGPKLIEYNVRFGDPECQALMLRLEDDLLELMLATAEGRLGEVEAVRLSPRHAITVVAAAAGYPGTPQAGGAIEGLHRAEALGATIFQAGTAMIDGALVANGGRVLGVSATGETLAQARDLAYRALDLIDFPDGFYRSDIGWREIARAG